MTSDNGLTTTNAAASLLECRSLACERDERLLFSDLGFELHSGDVVQIEGPNGSGKTTLLRAISLLLPEYQGQILWKGKPVDNVRTDFLSHLLFIGHLPGVKKNLTPRENLRFLMSLSHPCSIEEIDKALEKVGLYGYEDMPGQQLSAGQQRRVALARLYLSKALLWILDEPYTAIDKQGVAHLEQCIADHAAAGGCVILTSHQAPSIQGLKRIVLDQYCPGQPSSLIQAND